MRRVDAIFPLALRFSAWAPSGLMARMRTKQEIIDEIRRTTRSNGGKPLGASRFERETGIKSYDWAKFWARFGDALQDAGFARNELKGAYSDEFLIEKIITLARKLNKFPTYREITVERTNDPRLPDKTVFGRLGTKVQLAKRVSELCAGRTDYEDILNLCLPLLDGDGEHAENPSSRGGETIGEVYLFKHGRHYKIGKTSDAVRRGSELRVQLPERLNLVHSIKTDDPSGVEAYWHRRFESKRMNGEWFNLDPSDLKAFKRWRRIV